MYLVVPSGGGMRASDPIWFRLRNHAGELQAQMRGLGGDVYIFFYNQSVSLTLTLSKPQKCADENKHEGKWGDLAECYQEAASSGVNQVMRWASANRPVSQYSALCSLQNRNMARVDFSM